MPPAEHRQNNFDALRLVAALCVVVSHQFALNGLHEPAVFGVHSVGGLGVLIFFSISGFLVAGSWQADPNAWRFLARRLLRIWPGLAVAVALVALVLGPMVSSLSLNEYYAQPMVRAYFKILLFNIRDALPLRFDGNALPTAINGPLWTIPLEVKCYLVLLVLGLAGLVSRRWRWLLLAVTLATAVFYCVGNPDGGGWRTPYDYLVTRRYPVEFGLFFFAGTAFQLFRVDQDRRRMALALAGCVVLAGVALAAGHPLLALWLAVPAGVVATGTASTPYLRRAGRLGDLSYGMYIYAFPVQQTTIWLIRDRLPWAAGLLLVVATTALLAFASWHLVERRALRLKPKGRAQRSRAGEEAQRPAVVEARP